MIFIIIFIVLPLIAFLLAIYADKKLEKFQIELQPNEILQLKKIDVDIEDTNSKKSYRGVLYLTNKKLVLYKYTYNWIELIPFVGNSIVSIWMDTLSNLQIPLADIKGYTFQNKILFKNNRLMYSDCHVVLNTKMNIEYKMVIPLDTIDDERAEILNKMDILRLNN